MLKCGIYKIISPNGKIYIGQSIDIIRRWATYKKYRCSSQPKLYNSFKKYGVENHNFEIIKECSKEDLNDLENHYIEFFNSYSIMGLNCNKTAQSKLETYNLIHNENRKKQERLIKKRESNKRYLLKKRMKNNKLLNLTNIYVPCPFGKGSFILDYNPNIYTCSKHDLDNLPF